MVKKEKNALGEINHRLDILKEEICDLEDTAIETVQKPTDSRITRNSQKRKHAKTTPRYIIIKLLKARNKGGTLNAPRRKRYIVNSRSVKI